MNERPQERHAGFPSLTALQTCGAIGGVERGETGGIAKVGFNRFLQLHQNPGMRRVGFGWAKESGGGRDMATTIPGGYCRHDSAG